MSVQRVQMSGKTLQPEWGVNPRYYLHVNPLPCPFYTSRRIPVISKLSVLMRGKILALVELNPWYSACTSRQSSRFIIY